MSSERAIVTIEELSGCNYLLEKTYFSYTSGTLITFGYWLENPVASLSAAAWRVYADSSVSGLRVNVNVVAGTRPVIEIRKFNIEY